VKDLYCKKENLKSFANALPTIYNEKSIKEKTAKEQKINYKVNLSFIGGLFLFVFTL